MAHPPSVDPAERRQVDRTGEPLLRVEDLHTCFDIEGKTAWALKGVSFDVWPGEVVGLVGESGSGKSVTSLSIMRLIPDPPGKIAQGRILFRGKDLLKLSYEDMRKVRGKEIGMIFQEPMTSLNPVFTIGMQVMEGLWHHEGLVGEPARKRAIAMMTEVGIPDPERRLADYPHQFSGGMRQRVMIAMALICNPALLIADEPTTALDVTIQAQILDLIEQLQAKRGDGSVLLITHDLAVVAETCDRVIVMYGGRVQEEAPVIELFDNPAHPYTQGLMGSIPHKVPKGQPLVAIPGNVPSIMTFPPGCRFCSRCPKVMDRCRTEEPELVEVAPGHKVRCHLTTDAAKAGSAA